ncbi:MAG: hypothetical protein KKF96_05825 [Proteobacteria bacterium]|nr:hypothetical protein [Pseudomonadota bacterium]
MSSIKLYGKKYAKDAIGVYLVDFSEDYEIWMDLIQAALYQIDRVLAGGTVILRAN